MFCSKCGKELRDDDVFCSGCGNKINRENEPKNDIQYTAPKKMKTSFHLDMLKSICIILGIILLVTGMYLWSTINSDIAEIKTFSQKYWVALHNEDDRFDETGKFNDINGEKHDTKIIETQSEVNRNSSTLDEYADNMYEFYMKEYMVIPIVCGGITLVALGIAVIFLNRKINRDKEM